MSLDDLQLLTAFVLSVAVLITLIGRYSLPPFVALIVASVALALMAGLPMAAAWEHFAAGVGGILSSTAMVIGLGAMTGALLQHSGGATAIAQWLIKLLGVNRLGWAMLLVGLVVGVGVWFTVGLVLLVPVAVAVTRVAGVGIVLPAMSMLAGLSAMHGLAPPHPGPLAAISVLNADIGRTILWSLVVGSIAAAIAGPVYWRWFGTSLKWHPLQDGSEAVVGDAANEPPGGVSAPLAVIALPILLMLLGSFAGNALTSEDAANSPYASVVHVLVALGTPTMALLIGLLLAYYLLGIRRGVPRRSIARLADQSLYPVANVLLVVGAGAGFSRVLIASGAGDALAELAQQVPLPTLALGWLIAAAFRVTTGSATTAITAAGGILSVMVGDDATVDRELLVLALGAGSLTLSHVNDGGFWFVKELFALTVQQTLKTWTVLETVLSIVALAILLLLDSIL